MKSKKTGVITQARTTSTRLPGKVLLTVGNKSILKHHTDRLQQAGLPVYIATTTNKTDDAIAAFARAEGIPVCRGDEQNVLSRFYECAKQHQLEVIVRVTSDCPLIDGFLVVDAVQQYLALNDEQVYLSNALQRTFPRGLDFEIFSFKLLEEAFRNAVQPEDLEHVTPYINQNKSGKVKIKHYTRPSDASHFRITLDTFEDLQVIKKLIEAYDAQHLRAEEIIRLLEAHPELSELNAQVEQKKLGE